MDTQNLYQKAIRFAASKHAEQNQLVVTSTLPYTVHLGNVAIEIPLACRHTQGFCCPSASRLNIGKI